VLGRAGELPPGCGQFVKPTDAELLQLQAIVLAKYPMLGEQKAKDFDRQFAAAFIGIAPITRSQIPAFDQPNHHSSR